MLKLRWSEIQQAISRLGVRLLGPDALAWEAARPLHAHDAPSGLDDDARPIVAQYLNARAYTIFGGTSEIQREIIARAYLERTAEAAPKPRSTTGRSTTGRSDSIGTAFAKSFARQLGSRTGQAVVRGILGSLFKSR
jgi:hypothetical protein